MNISGGKWIIRLKKGVADRIWEDLVLAVLGDQFDEVRLTEDSGADSTVASSWEDGSDSGAELPEICGCTISVRQSEDIISLWNRVDGDIKVRERIRSVVAPLCVVPFLFAAFPGIPYERSFIFLLRLSWSTSRTMVRRHSHSVFLPC